MDSDEFAALLAGAMMACALILVLEITRPKRSLPYAPPLPMPPPHCWTCDVERRELEQFGHTHAPAKRTPTVAPAARGK